MLHIVVFSEAYSMEGLLYRAADDEGKMTTDYVDQSLDLINRLRVSNADTDVGTNVVLNT